MKEQQNKAIEFIKTLNVKGCITGSSLLPDYYEGSDIDIFAYDAPSFLKLYYTLKLNPQITVLDKLELWKASIIEEKELTSNKHFTGVTSFKFYFNTCIPINIVLKKNCTNIFSVLNTFDMDIVCIGYCLQTKQTLDLSGNSHTTKIANYNRWNPAFESEEVWQLNRIIRQIERVIKYYKRGWNTDPIMFKYLKLIDKIQNFDNIFSSENFDTKLKISQENTKIVKSICLLWLEKHEISDKELELLKEKIKEI